MNVTPQPTDPLASARAHWTIYLPSAVVALVWAVVYFWANLHEPPLTALRSLSIAVEILAVPPLLFVAAIRARIIAAEVRAVRERGGAPTGPRQLWLRQGFGRMSEVRIGADEIAFVRVRRSLAQRLCGGGALEIRTMSGERVWIGDLDRPDAIAHAITVGHTRSFRQGSHMPKLN